MRIPALTRTTPLTIAYAVMKPKSANTPAAGCASRATPQSNGGGRWDHAGISQLATATSQPMTPVVLVPGLLCSAEVFAPQVTALWPYGQVTIASTLEGESIAQMADAILAAAPPHFALAGISMGGYLSLEIMRQAPERVTRLALLDTSARPDTPEQTARRRSLLALAQSGDFETVAVKALTALLHPARQSDPTLRDTNLRMARTLGVTGLARQTEAIIARRDSRPFLAQITISTLVLVGDTDAVTPADHAEEIAAAIPGAKLVVIPDCGHASTLEQPDAVNRALLDWICAD